MEKLSLLNIFNANTATLAAVIMFGMYITTLKNPFAGIFSFASVNHTAKIIERIICGKKFITQILNVLDNALKKPSRIPACT